MYRKIVLERSNLGIVSLIGKYSVRYGYDSVFSKWVISVLSISVSKSYTHFSQTNDKLYMLV